MQEAPKEQEKQSASSVGVTTGLSPEERKQLATDTSELFANLSLAMQSDLRLAAEDYKLLSAMNGAAADKYENMQEVLLNLSKHVQDLKSKYKSFEPYLAKVDEICENVTQIEQTVILLDDYTTRLEAKFKSLESANEALPQPNK